MSTTEEILPLEFQIKCPPKCSKGYRCKKNICTANKKVDGDKKVVKAKTVKVKEPKVVKEKKEKVVKVKVVKEKTVKVPKEKVVKVKTVKVPKEKVVKVKTVKVPKEKVVKEKKVKVPKVVKEKVIKEKKIKEPKVKKEKVVKVKTEKTEEVKIKKRKTKKLILSDKTPSPVKAKTPTPVKVRTPTPVKAKTPTPVKAKTPTPVKARTPTPVKPKTPSPSPVKQVIRLIYKAKPYTGIMVDVAIVKNALKAYKIEEVNLLNKAEYTKKHDKVFVQIFFEHIFIEEYKEILPAMTSYILVNHEWVYDWDMIAMRRGVIPLCKTILAYNLLNNVRPPSKAGLLATLNPLYVGFGNNDPLPAYSEKIEGLAIHFAGASPTKGTLNLMEVWDKYIYREGVLIVGFSNEHNQQKDLLDFWESLKPHRKVLLPSNIVKKSRLLENLYFERVGSLYLYKGSLDNTVKMYLQAVAELHICPSIIEGWGHYIDEARRNKANVLVLDAPPMNELIFASYIDTKGHKVSTKQCIPSKNAGVMKNNISNAWAAFLQKDYPIMTYEPETRRIMADYILRALNSTKYKDAINMNAERSQLEGAQFVESMNILLSPGNNTTYFQDLVKMRQKLLLSHSSNVSSPVKVQEEQAQAQQAQAQLKYCCPSIRNPDECSLMTANIKNKLDKYAIMTLIFGGDAYLPGVLMLGSSIRRVFTPDIKNVELCCMVTKDVSSTARALISKIYDKIIDVDYIEIDPSLIRHSNPKMKAIYAKTFTKLRIFELTQYNKILFLDADMLVLKREIFGLFNLGTPACIYMGHLSSDLRDRYFKEFAENGKLFKKFQKQYCRIGNKELHGSRIPYTKGKDDEETASGMNIETSLMLIRPGHGIARERDDFLEDLRKPIRGDTEMVSRMFTDRIHAIDPRFFGRWVNPYEHDELVVLDLYGTMGKPWDVDKFAELTRFISAGDMSYWWETYVNMYQSEYYDYENPMLDKLYQSIMNNKIIRMHTF